MLFHGKWEATYQFKPVEGGIVLTKDADVSVHHPR